MYPKTFEEACTITGENPSDEKFSTGTPDEIAYKKLKFIVAATNREDNSGKEWNPDWNDRNVRKWFPWWDKEVDSNNPSGFRLIDSFYDITTTYTPSRLCFKSKDGLLHVCESKAFLPLWKDFMTMPK